MKKLFTIIGLGLLLMSKTYAYDYCNEYLKSSRPLDNPSMVNIALLQSELTCLGKDKEALMFQEQMHEMMRKHIKGWVEIMVDADENDKRIANQMEQDYINSVVNLFHKLKDN